MKIDWMALLTVFGVSLVTVLGLVILFCAGIRALSSGSKLGASASFSAFGAVVLYGLYLIVAG